MDFEVTLTFYLTILSDASSLNIFEIYYSFENINSKTDCSFRDDHHG